MAIYKVVIGSFTSTKSVYRTEMVEAESEQAATDSINISTDEFWACTNLISEQDERDLDEFERRDAEYVAYLESVGFFNDPSAAALEAYDDPF